MFHCPLCHTAAHVRTSRYFTDTTKERYRPVHKYQLQLHVRHDGNGQALYRKAG